MTATDDLAEQLQNWFAYRGAANDLVRSIGIGPADLARLTLTPRSERRAVLAALLLAPDADEKGTSIVCTPGGEPEPPPAAARAVDNLPAWRRDHIERQAAKRR